VFLQLFNIPELTRGDLRFGNKSFLGNGIPSFVRILINIPGIVNHLQGFLDNIDMTVFGRPYKIIVLDMQLFPKLNETRSQIIAVNLRRHASFLGCLLDLLAMLV